MPESIGLAIICNKVSDSLEKMLESFTPHLDQTVLVATTVDLEQLEALRVLCERHGVECHPLKDISILDEENNLLDFSAARNETFQYVKTDWYFWADSDDLLAQPENLRLLIANAPSDIHGYWLPYYYATDEHGNPTTLHIRERLVRMAVGWKWQNRVHETLVPSYPARWLQSNEVYVIHASENSNKTPRNLRLLNLMHQEDPDNPRVWLYFGYQFFANNEWAKAAEWFEKAHTDRRVLPLERWGALCYHALAIKSLGRYETAIQLLNAAIFSMPELSSAYVYMAECYLDLGEYIKAKEWARNALLHEPPNEIMFINTLDHSFMPYKVLAFAHAGLGELEQAVEALKEAVAVRPEKELVEALEKWPAAITKRREIEAYLRLAPALPDEERLGLAHHFWNGNEPEVRDITIPAQLRLTRRGTQPEIHIFCGPSNTPWAAPTPDETGIGGSETAVVEVTKRLAKDGWRPIVYNDPRHLEGEYDGVFYLDWRRWRRDEKPEVLVSWRDPHFPQNKPQAKELWLWNHDLNRGPEGLKASWGSFSKVFGVSKWHADYLRRAYPIPEHVQVGHLYNGINPSRFTPSEPVKKQTWKCVYTSSPDRALHHLLHLWPQIHTREPKAELHIFYGWNNIDRMIAEGDRGLAQYKALVLSQLKRLENMNVHWRGKVSQKELAQELLTAELWLYPTSFTEVFCINAVEAMAAGCSLVTSRCGALPEVIGDTFPLVPGKAGSPTYNHQWLGLAFAFLMDVETRVVYRGKGQERAAQFTWDKAYETCWLPNLKEAVKA